jgi:hypothetical protein
MSFWARVETKITDLDVMKRVCETNDLTYQQNGLGLDLYGRSNSGEHARVENVAPNEWQLSYDQDPSYSAFSRRFGKNGGTLMRSYAAEMAKREASMMGYMLMSEEVQQDGSLRLVVGF